LSIYEYVVLLKKGSQTGVEEDIGASNREKAVRAWRKLHEEIHGSYCSRLITVVIPSAGLSKRRARLRSLWRAPKCYCEEQKKKKGLKFWYIIVS
jgi:hypothetical protein